MNKSQHDKIYNLALNDAICICDEEARLYEANSEKCDKAKNYLGGYGDAQSSATAKNIRERIRGLMK
jgi:hypothetical protein